MTAANDIADRVHTIIGHRQPLPRSAGRILEALAAVPDNDGLTAAEVAQAVGLSTVRVYALLRQMTLARRVAVTANVPIHVYGRVRVWRLP